MLFNSYIFLLFFLPLTILLYFGLNHLGREKAAQIVLIGLSLFFYAYFHVSYLFIMLGSILFNFSFARMLRIQKVSNWRNVLLAAGVLGNLGVIFYYKYFNFFLDNVNLLFHRSFVWEEVLMPLGISFFTFQQIAYLVDTYRGEAEYNFVDYALFVTFFPQLVAGPIVWHEEMIPQFHDPERKRIRQDRMAQGLWWLAVGLAKKVLIADTLGKGSDWGYTHVASLGGMDVFVVSLLYCLQLYFDFSGYCDMAIGMASMLQFDLPLNFNSPYKSVSIADFWRRWHMTLSRFLQKYIYFPLGGSRKGEVRTAANLMIVFLISGIWHGANWTFILWGVLHGIASVLYRYFRRIWDRLPKTLRWGVNFLFIDLTWILFRADSLADARLMYARLFRTWKLSLSQGLLEQFDILEFTYLEEHSAALRGVVTVFPALHLTIVLLLAMGIALIPRNCHEKTFVPTLGRALGCIVLFLWSLLSLSGLSSFLYFNF